MSEFRTTFIAGEIAREIAVRGLSLEEFAALAEIDDKTLTRAIQGLPLRHKTFGKILKALGARRGSDLSRLVASA